MRAANPAVLFAKRSDTYARFIRFVLYSQGIRAFFTSSPLLRSGLRILDAGCGAGAVTLALREALLARAMTPDVLHGFDLTPAMLERFRRSLSRRGIGGVELAQADVLELGTLPASWTDYDLVVTASMLEYVPRDRLHEALSGLRKLMKPGGALVLFITRRNLLTRPLIGWWWDANLYRAGEVCDAFQHAGFSSVTFRNFPLRYRQLALWGYVVEALP